jgi:hypothetical protein
MSLKWLRTLNNPSGRLACWAVQLSCSKAIQFAGGRTSQGDWYNKLINNVQSNPAFHKNYIIKDNILFRFCKPLHELQNDSSWKMVLYRDHIQACMKENHEGEAVHPLSTATTETVTSFLESVYS